MCHISNLIFAKCGCKRMWQIYCDKNSPVLCEGGRGCAVVSLYLLDEGCMACFDIYAQSQFMERKDKVNADPDGDPFDMIALQAQVMSKRAQLEDDLEMGIAYTKEHSKAMWNVYCIGEDEDKVMLDKVEALMPRDVTVLPVRPSLRGGPRSPFRTVISSESDTAGGACATGEASKKTESRSATRAIRDDEMAEAGDGLNYKVESRSPEPMRGRASAESSQHAQATAPRLLPSSIARGFRSDSAGSLAPRRHNPIDSAFMEDDEDSDEHDGDNGGIRMRGYSNYSPASPAADSSLGDIDESLQDEGLQGEVENPAPMAALTAGISA